MLQIYNENFAHLCTYQYFIECVNHFGLEKVQNFAKKCDNPHEFSDLCIKNS